ncbi:hypothetical protein OKW98_03905 [Pseudomonas sp. KU26590]|uniref:hypothetical protein n=1 Tax=Pseudomonas sp. KU26590 TaxID=2991051 RepID=UPI00223E3B69|nr:hypothetical protein [Pseudomonas sp. KU26590]UZJ60897.1 hypothetical protein OKW98_03905 [Pseudomonas sp. KU26590]
MTCENALPLNKEIRDCTDVELVALQNATTVELKRRVRENLESVADQYIYLFGKKEGMEEIGEDLCRLVAPNRHPGGWCGLVQHLVKISG